MSNLFENLQNFLMHDLYVYNDIDKKTSVIIDFK